MKWFKDCKTIDDVKKAYRRLCKEYHPDLNGGSTTEIMQEINAEYETAFNKFKNIHESADGTTYEKETTETPEEFRNIIESLINCEGLIIDLVGRWIWLTGNTYQHKEIIKKLGFKWASKKSAWYWHNPDEVSKNRKKMTLDEIKAMHGCETYKAKSTIKIAAAM